MIKWSFECPGFDPFEELVVVEEEAQPIHGMQKGLNILGNKGTLTVTFDPPLAPVYGDDD